MSERKGECKERLDAWYDGSAICLIAVGAHGDPLDLGDDEVRALIARLELCLAQSQADAVPAGQGEN